MNGARPRVPRVVWLLAAIAPLFFLEQFVRHFAGQGWDYLPVWNAARNLLHHHPVYFQGRPAGGPAWPDTYYLFLYPPSTLLLVWPLGLLGFTSSKLLFFLADSAAIVLAGALCLRLVGVRWRSPAGFAVLGALFLALPVTDTLHSENVNGLVVAAEAATLLAAARRRWLLAAAFLGLSLLIKPILLPLIVLFVLARKWRPALLAVAIPVAASLIVVPFFADGRQFFSQVLPFLVSGNAAEFQKFNISLAGQAAIAGLPPILTLLLRGLLLALGSLLVWVRWKRGGDEAVRLAEVSGVILLVTLLGFSFAWPYHVLFLLPWVVSGWHPDSLFHRPLPWLGIVLAASPDIALMERPGDGLLFHLAIARMTAGLLLLLLVAADAWLLRRATLRRTVEPSPDRTPRPASVA